MSMWLGDLAGSEGNGFDHAFLAGHIGKLFGHQTCHRSDLRMRAAKCENAAKSEEYKQDSLVHLRLPSTRIATGRACCRVPSVRGKPTPLVWSTTVWVPPLGPTAVRLREVPLRMGSTKEQRIHAEWKAFAT